ncbi:MAG: response regulator [Bacteroidota bacterium]|nr:response regulator [Bacteroidota bacterium]
MDTPYQNREIFHADDDQDDRTLFKEALGDIGFSGKVSFLKNGDELMQKLGEKIPDVIFLDLNMPGKDGFDCLKEIREDDMLKQIPVVIFSTSDNPVAINKTYALGANFYIRKPTSFGLLKKAIRIILATDLYQKPQRENYFLEVA